MIQPETTKTVAARRGCHPATVARIAAREKIGVKAGRDWIFSQEQAKILEKMIRDQAGNPNFSRLAEKKKRKKTR